MSGVLLDTNAVIDDAKVPAPTSISVVTMIELASGLHVPVSSAVRAQRRARYQQIAHVYAPIPVNDRVVTGYIEVDAAMRRSGRNPRPRRMDLIIAATALAYDLELVTSDISDYRGLEDLVTVRLP